MPAGQDLSLQIQEEQTREFHNLVKKEDIRARQYLPAVILEVVYTSNTPVHQMSAVLRSISAVMFISKWSSLFIRGIMFRNSSSVKRRLLLFRILHYSISSRRMSAGRRKLLFFMYRKRRTNSRNLLRFRNSLL